MFEVELKAHADDRNFVISTLNSFAEYETSVQKIDTYWGKIQDGKKVQARIRKLLPQDNPKEAKFFFTYKQKEVRKNESGIEIEVNDEKECEISDPIPFEAFFKDSGMEILLEKTKATIGWFFEDAHIELCTVPPLGDFLEIEIICESADEAKVAECRNKIISLFKKCGIGEDKIENRYYSEMLREARK